VNAEAYESAGAVRAFTRVVGLRPVEEFLVSRHFRRTEPVLDLGCGAGRTTHALAVLGYQPIGLDLSGTLLAAARHASPQGRFVRADVRSLPFPSAHFAQALFSFNGIDYVYPLADLRSAFREIQRVLRPGGVFVYSGHNVLGHFGRYGRSWRTCTTRSLRELAGFVKRQARGAKITDWYWRFDESFGPLTTFAAPPFVRRQLHADVALETLEVHGNTPRQSERALNLFEPRVHYVVRKR
jgi:SAM-dependent methyltransferase